MFLKFLFSFKTAIVHQTLAQLFPIAPSSSHLQLKLQLLDLDNVKRMGDSCRRVAVDNF